MNTLARLLLLAALFSGVASAQVPIYNKAPFSAGSAIGGTCTGCTAGSILYVGAGPVLAQDNTNLIYTNASGKRLQIGSGSGTSQGWIFGSDYAASSGYSGIYTTAAAASATNYVLLSDGSGTYLNSPLGTDTIYFRTGGTGKASIYGTAGRGFEVTAGTATTAVSALTITQTWNYNAAAITGVKWTFTDTSSHASTNAFQILGGAAGTTNLLSLSKAGVLTVPSVFVSDASGASISIYTVENKIMLGSAIAGIALSSVYKLGWASTTDASQTLDSNISRISAGLLAIGTGAVNSFAGRLKLTSNIVAAVAVGSLNASPTIGEVQTVNDALAVAAKGATVAAGGSAVCQVMWNGANWVGI